MVNRVDPSGLCTDCRSAFRVNPMEAGLPSERISVMEKFNNTHWNLPLDVWDVLGREMNFVRWMQTSGRLTDPRAGNWYDVADAYLVASRFAGARLIDDLKGNYQCGTPYTGPLEPGVVEWAAFVFAAEQTRINVAYLYLQLIHFFGMNNALLVSGSTIMNIGFWRAHNAALREGVRRADAAGLRAIEPAEERMLINYILYNVLEPGDQCGNGNMAFCGFTLPFQLYIGAFHIYPQDYPANQQDLDVVSAVFRPIYGAWSLLDVRLPDPEIHLIK